MPTSSIRHLRADLATAVRRAGAGERLVITVGGRPCAQLGPLEAPEGTDRPSIDALVARGLLEPPRRSTPVRFDEPVPVWSGTRLDRVLREVRG